MEPSTDRPRLKGMKPFDGMPLRADIRLYHAPTPEPGPNFVHASNNIIIKKEDAIPPEVAERAARFHPRGVAYTVPAPHRALAHMLNHPSLAATGFAALALYGLPFLADCADTVLTGPAVPRKQLATASRPGLTRSDPCELWRLQFFQKVLSAVPPAVALAQALALVKKGEAAWEVVPVPECGDTFVRAVQLVDAARRFLSIDPVELLAASRQRVDLPWLVSVLIASSTLADSPKESEMRLLAQEIARTFKLTLTEQFVLSDASGRAVTRFDLAFVELKIGLMYDGAQHWEHKRRHKDTRINLEAAVLDWQVLRFSAWTLELLIPTLDRILTARGLTGTRSAG